MKRALPVRQGGAALLALMVVVVLAFAYVLTNRLSTAAGRTVLDREHNARVMSQAKRALIGWMLLNAAQTDNNPGRLPCPEAANNIGTSSEGITAPMVVPSTPTCATVGRLPWRTLGLDKLVDAANEPLWYAVSPGWRLQNSATRLTINSDSRGQMAVDGAAAPNEVIALIIAPGTAMKVQAAAGCAARDQARSAPAPSMDARDYIECFDAATPAFSTVGPVDSFNDQVIRVTTGDLIPALEAAIQQRMQREIAPALRGVYSSAEWGSQPLLPFAAPFADPGSSNYQGINDGYQGLLPFTSSAASCGTDPRCSTTFVQWIGGATAVSVASGTGVILSQSCTLSATQVRCTGLFLGVGNVSLAVTARVSNMGMALRTLDPAGMSVRYGLVILPVTPWAPGDAASATMRNDGQADVTLRGPAVGSGLLVSLNYEIVADIGAIADHPLLDPDSTGPGATGWFVRNEWYRLVYYAAAPRNTPEGLSGTYGSFGCVSGDCLSFNSNTRNIRGLLVLTGRSLSSAARPNANLADYLEYQNCNLSGGVCTQPTRFEQRPIRTSQVAIPAINTPFNDRVVLVDWIAPNPTFPLAALP